MAFTSYVIPNREAFTSYNTKQRDSILNKSLPDIPTSFYIMYNRF